MRSTITRIALCAVVICVAYMIGRVNRGYEGMRFCVPADDVQPSFIPRIIYRTWSTKVLDECPSNMQRAWAVTETANPTVQQIIFDDDDVDAYMRSDEVPKAWSDAFFKISDDYPSAKADMWRYVITYLRGGLYLDNKSSAHDIPEYVFNTKGAMFVSPWKLLYRLSPVQIVSSLTSYGLDGEMAQWWLACSRGHPVMKRVIEGVVANIESESKNCSSEMTGIRGKIRILTAQLPIFKITGPFHFTDTVLEAQRRAAREGLDEDESTFCVIGSRPNLGCMVYDEVGGHVWKQLFGNHYSSKKSHLVNSCDTS